MRVCLPSVLIVLSVFALAGCPQSRTNGWPDPTGSPSADHESGLVQMMEEHTAAAEMRPADRYQIVYWWEGDSVPTYFDGRERVRAESLARIDCLNAAGQSIDQNWVFLRWNGKTPYCVAVLSDTLEIPSEYRN